MRSGRRKVAVFAAAVVVVIAAGGTAVWLRSPKPNCDFPDAVRQSTSLALYCPDSTKLPAGISADISKASASGNAVIIPMRDGHTPLAVSLQPKPTKDQLTHFIANIIPLHFDADTSVGKGAIGVTAQGQSLLDLPTERSTWILVTGPKNYDSQRMTKIAKSFVPDKS